MRWLFLVGGGVATAAMLGISMRLNYLFGHGLGQTPDNALVFGAVSVIADAWKGLGPVFILTLARARRWPTATAAIIVWVACFLYSVSSALGIAIQDRTMLTGGRETLQAGYADVKRQLDDVEGKRRALGKNRSAGELEAAIGVVLMRPVSSGQRIRGTVRSVSVNCSRVDTRTTGACAEISILRQEFAVAVEAVRLDQRIAELRRQAAQLRERGATLSSDPQAELFARLTGGWVSARDVGPGLALLLAVVIELVSAFGPVVLAGYTDAARYDSHRLDQLRATSAVEYMLERIEPAGKGSAISCDALYADYQSWCERKGTNALSGTAFIVEFDRSRIEHRLEKIQKFGDRYYGVQLLEAAT